MSYICRLMIGTVVVLCVTCGAMALGELTPTDRQYVKKMARKFGDVDPTGTPILSPDGKHVALIRYVGENSQLLVYKIVGNKLEPTLALQEEETMQFTWINWASPEKLLVGIYQPGNGRNIFWRRIMMAMNVDGSEGRVLVTARRKRISKLKDFNPYLDRLANTLPDDPDHILVYYSDGIVSNPDLFKVNLHTSEMTLHEEIPNKKKTYSWYSDRTGSARIAFLERKKKSGLMMIKNADGTWREVDNPDMFQEGRFSIEGFSEDPNYAYVTSSYATGRRALFKFDLRTATLAEKVFEHEEVDVRGVFLSPASSKPVAVTWLNHEIEMKFFDKDFSRLYRGIRKSINKPFRITSMSTDEQWAIVVSSSPTEPGVYYLLDRKKGKMDPIHFKLEKMAKDSLHPMQHVKYEARDALEINAYVTYPKKDPAKVGPLPLVVLPHGGPASRNYMTWDEEVQFLASLGYVVLQPNFRGSSGYGGEFLAKGDDEWSRGMINDMIDGVEYLAQEGKIDPKRVCIVGTSYGGYAALMAAVKHSSVFRCAASMAGISDIKSMLKYDDAYSKRDWYYQHVAGNRPKGKLKEISPITFVEDLQIPVLLGHGMEDEVVEPSQSEKFYKKAKKAGKDVKYLTYEDDGHGFRWERSQINWFRNLGLFLFEHNPPGMKKKTASSAADENAR